MNNIDKKLEEIFKDNVNVPDSFENAIRNALDKKGMVNMKKRFISKKVLIVLMILIVLIVRRNWCISGS